MIARGWIEDEKPPPELAYLWRWFVELSATRDVGFGPTRIKQREIMAWAFLSGIRPTLFELDVLQRIDAMWLRMAHEKIEAERPKDGKGVRDQVRVGDRKGVMRVLRNLAARAGSGRKKKA